MSDRTKRRRLLDEINEIQHIRGDRIFKCITKYYY